MSSRLLNWICNLYCAGMLITFGYSYNADFYVSRTATIGDVILINTINSGIKSAVWPLYWSVVAFEYKRPKP